jgi:peptide/nickel transport system permease protein
MRQAARISPRFLVGGGMVLAVVAFAVIGPLVLDDAGASVGGRYDPPSGRAWLGTDDLGHDVLTTLAYSSRTSLLIGLLAGLGATLIGTVIGLLAGYHGGRLEELLMGLTNIVLAIPAFVILILLSIALGSRSAVTVAVVIAVASWTWTARAVAAQSSSLRTREHLDVARLSGARTPGILLVDVLPYLLSYICMAFVLQVSTAILAEAGLSLLGLGPSHGYSLGLMLNWALAGEAVRTGAYWAFLVPTALLTAIAFGLLMLQSSLDEVFNPRLRGGSSKPRGRREADSTAAATVHGGGA